eukprot:CAMPEP_0174855274 /NCGR_PEP_ID=MMETSP1114-20130205/32890_1 /TAXON_ID=312471 /ORGANISM="Neobodo designis, Strain CCAP 1951/1" /LENGTH=125 /DNA_ID=CAMNT_0016090009 /DNA_START=41 /DNA_END=415 /DNA_ORIENTATION=+
MREWHFGVFGCCGDRRVLADTLCCAPCSIGRQWNAVRGSEDDLNVPVCCAATILAPCTAAFTCLLRLRVVEKYQIDEPTVRTVAAGVCCAACSACQTYRELNVRNTWPGCTFPRRCLGPPPVAIA